MDQVRLQIVDQALGTQLRCPSDEQVVPVG
jgi:hypothetical protein